MQGILMKPDMIQATVEGRKTNTRRAEASLREINKEPDEWVRFEARDNIQGLFSFYSFAKAALRVCKSRYHAGETVYIKEAIQQSGDFAVYRLGQQPVMFFQSLNRFHWRWQKDYLSPLHLPQEAARHFILIEAVRAERLWEISWADCLAEGIIQRGDDFICKCAYSVPQGAFIELWNSINPKQPWESNPVCWVYSFVKIDKPVGMGLECGYAT